MTFPSQGRGGPVVPLGCTGADSREVAPYDEAEAPALVVMGFGVPGALIAEAAVAGIDVRLVDLAAEPTQPWRAADR